MQNDDDLHYDDDDDNKSHLLPADHAVDHGDLLNWLMSQLKELRGTIIKQTKSADWSVAPIGGP